MQDEAPLVPVNWLRWIDTKVMLADPLTKVMKDLLLQSVLDSGVWCVAQPEAGKLEKEKKAQWRKPQRQAKTEAQGDDINGTIEP